MEALRRWIERDLTLTNVVITLFVVAQCAGYATKWVWAQDNDARVMQQRVESLEQTVKAQHEAIETQHTFSEVVNVRLSNIEQQLRELKELVLKEKTR